MTDRRLMRWDSSHGLTEVADLSDHAPWHCNDMVVDGEGGAYIGNLGWDDESDPEIRPTVLLHVDGTGKVAVAADDLVNPNGMAITADGRTLLVAETFAARITAFSRSSDGRLGRRRTWASFADREFRTVDEALSSRALLPDGIALDEYGALWVGDCHGSGATRVAPGGEILDHVSTAPLATFAVVLGGSGRRTLYMCAAPPYGTPEHRLRRDGRMCACSVTTPGAGIP